MRMFNIYPAATLFLYFIISLLLHHSAVARSLSTRQSSETCPVLLSPQPPSSTSPSPPPSQSLSSTPSPFSSPSSLPLLSPSASIQPIVSISSTSSSSQNPTSQGSSSVTSPAPSSRAHPSQRSTPKSIVQRVVGGLQANSNLSAALVRLSGGCSGALVAPRTVISAAHCNIVAGDTAYIGGRRGWSGIPRKIISVRIPREYVAINGSSTGTGYDFLVATLSNPAPSLSFFMRFNVNPKFPVPGAAVRLAGYGIFGLDLTTNEEVPNNGSVLHQVDMPVVEMDTCRYAYDYGREERMEFCSGYSAGGCSSCLGDSGGPVFQYDPSGNPVLVGVPTRTSCGRPGGFSLQTRVAAFESLLNGTGVIKSRNAEQVIPKNVQETDVASPTPFESTWMENDNFAVFHELVIWICGLLFLFGVCFISVRCCRVQNSNEPEVRDEPHL